MLATEALLEVADGGGAFALVDRQIAHESERLSVEAAGHQCQH